MRWLVNWLNGGTDDSSSVNIGQALGYPPILYAHNKLCGDFARLPIDVKRRKGDGAINDLRHDGYRLLRDEPNKLQSPSVFKEQVLSHAIMHGNGRVAIIRDGNGIRELIPMMPDRTETIVYQGEKYHATNPMRPDNRDLFSGKELNNAGWLLFHDRDVLHIPGFSYDGVIGLGLLDLAKLTFSIGIDSQKHVSKQMNKGFVGKLFLEAPVGSFREESAAKEFIDSFNASEAGADNAGKAGLLREGVKISGVSQSSRDAQLVELQKFNRQDIALLFGIDSMPFDGESVSYNSLEQKNLSYLSTLDRWLCKVEEECDRKLRTPRQISSQSHYFKVNRAALLRTDLATTMEALCKAVSHKIMNPNEARSKLDMNPYVGGDIFENPNTSTSDSKTDPESNDTATQPAASNLALEDTLKTLCGREAADAINGTNKENFVGWIDKYYNNWESKLADKLENIGLDRDIARLHCEESREHLLEAAGRSGSDNLKANVENTVKNWKYRAYRILELNKNES